MDEIEIRRIIAETVQTTVNSMSARYERPRDPRDSDEWLIWQEIAPRVKRRVLILMGLVFVVGIAVGIVADRVVLS